MGDPSTGLSTAARFNHHHNHIEHDICITELKQITAKMGNTQTATAEQIAGDWESEFRTRTKGSELMTTITDEQLKP